MEHVLEILCRVFSEPTYGLKVSFIIKPVCSCTKPQRYIFIIWLFVLEEYLLVDT